MATSKSTQLASHIARDYLRDDALRPGDRLPSIRALQEQYGVSMTVVSHALSMLSAKGLIEVRHGIGCFLAKKPGATMAERSRTIGLVLPFESTLELMGRIMKGVESVCRQRGYYVLFANTTNDYDTERRQIERFVNTGCEAVVLFPAVRTKRQIESDYLNSAFLDFPIILVDMTHPEQLRPQVIFDNRRVGYEVTERLVRAGHRRIAFMTYGARNSEDFHRSNSDRHAGYVAALQDAGIHPRPEWRWPIEVGPDIIGEQIHAHLKTWQTLTEPPSAVVAIEDLHGVTTIIHARELGIDVPEQLCVVGFDNLSMAKAVSPPMMTTEADFVRAGEMAAELALDPLTTSVSRPSIYVLPVPLLNVQAVRGPAEQMVKAR